MPQKRILTKTEQCERGLSVTLKKVGSYMQGFTVFTLSAYEASEETVEDFLITDQK